MYPIRNLFAAALLLSAAALYANDNRFEHAVNKTVRYQGGRISIENAFGAVNVHGGQAGEVEVHAVIRASNEELSNHIRVDISGNSEGVTITTDVPDIIRNASFSVAVDVAIPQNPCATP